MTLEEFKTHVDKLSNLLDDPQPGTMSWNLMLQNRMNYLLINWYNFDKDDLVKKVANNFPCFSFDNVNPLFCSAVDINEVVDFILNELGIRNE